MQTADIPGCGRTDHRSEILSHVYDKTHTHSRTQTQHVRKQHMHVIVPRSLPRRLLLLLLLVVVVVVVPL